MASWQHTDIGMKHSLPCSGSVLIILYNYSFKSSAGLSKYSTILRKVGTIKFLSDILIIFNEFSAHFLVIKDPHVQQ